MSSLFFQFVGDMGKIHIFCRMREKKGVSKAKRRTRSDIPKRRERMPSGSAEDCTLLRPYRALCRCFVEIIPRFCPAKTEDSAIKIRKSSTGSRDGPKIRARSRNNPNACAPPADVDERGRAAWPSSQNGAATEAFHFRAAPPYGFRFSRSEIDQLPLNLNVPSGKASPDTSTPSGITATMTLLSAKARLPMD